MSATPAIHRYEIVYMLKPELSHEAINKVHDKLRETIELGKGVMIKQQVWGKRKLAYPIARQNVGIYLVAEFLAHEAGIGGPTLVTEVERTLGINENVLRFITVQREAKVDPAAYPTAERKPILDGIAVIEEIQTSVTTRTGAESADEVDEDEHALDEL